MRTAILYYRRPPDRIVKIETQLLEETSDLVIFQHTIRTSKPLKVSGSTFLDDGYDAVWFIYREQYHDIGIISDLTGNFTGYYCDAILPIIDRNGVFEITDLFLDLWVTPDERTIVLDENELKEAIFKGWVSNEEARIAREEIDRMIRGVMEGNFPPGRVRDYVVRRK